MRLLREYIKNLLEVDYQQIRDASEQCTNATVLAIAHYFGDEDKIPRDACLGHVTGIDMHMYLQDMGYKLTNEHRWFQQMAMKGERTTLKQFMVDFPTGVYSLASNRHSMALIDGELVDTAEFQRLGNVKLVDAVRVDK